MTTLATETTSADNDVRSANNGDNAGYCDNHSTMTAMQRTMLEAPTTMTTLATATSCTTAENDVRSHQPQHTDNNADNDVRSTTTMTTLATATTSAH